MFPDRGCGGEKSHSSRVLAYGPEANGSLLKRNKEGRKSNSILPPLCHSDVDYQERIRDG